MSGVPLEPSGDQFRSLTDRIAELIAEVVADLPRSPASGAPADPDLLAALAAPPPESPRDAEPLLALVRRAAAQARETAGPGYLAYIPGGGLLSSAAANLLAAGLNRFTGKVMTAPALVTLEESVLRWMCDLFGFPANSQGLLTTGGSTSNLIAIVAARTRGADRQVDRAAIYVGEHAHGSMAKAARTAGLPREHVRIVRSTPDLRLDVEHLRDRIAGDRAAGLIPVCISAAAGTTNTGTIDPLGAVAEAAREEGIWFHVDGAYGGLFQLTGRGRERLRGIEQADSITLDPHKSLFLPYGTGALVVRSRDPLQQAFAEPADYMQDLGSADSLPELDTMTPELTRDYRGLRVWLPLHLHGVAAFRRELDEKLDLARAVYEALSSDPRLDVPWAPDLSVVVFRLRGGDDAAQLRLLERINATQRILLSSTRIGGEVWLRVAVLSFRTHADRIEEAIRIISDSAAERQ